MLDFSFTQLKTGKEVRARIDKTIYYYMLFCLNPYLLLLRALFDMGTHFTQKIIWLYEAIQLLTLSECGMFQIYTDSNPLRGRTHVSIKGQNLNFYLETPHNIDATPHNFYFIRLRILPRILGTLYLSLIHI